jgi:hypothetical protein
MSGLKSGYRLDLSLHAAVRTDQARQFVTEVLIPSLRCRNPVAISPRRIVTDMLLMSALQIRNPIEAFIQMKIYNLARSTRLRCREFHA